MTIQSLETFISPRFEVVYRTLNTFAERMNKPMAPPDGFLTARVIGEFSAGKTRLLRELLGDVIPPALFPVSSLERQTRLQLELTYGETAELTVIERAHDHSKTQKIVSLTNFPMREEMTDYDPLVHRLRLAVPEKRLILPLGDRYSDDTSPKRLFLIDMPGWNSGDDDIAESQAANILAGFHNLSLVFVTDASRLDGLKNSERLREFLEAFADADFVGIPNLIFVITHCPKADHDRLGARAHERVLELWCELGHEPQALGLHIMCVDFAELENGELMQFREQFWSHLLAPLEFKEQVQHPWIENLKQWPEAWNIRPKLVQTQSLLDRVRKPLELTFKEGDFLVGMNMYRLMGLDKAGIHKKVRGEWIRKSGNFDYTEIDLNHEIAEIAKIDHAHPLADWWTHYWVENLKLTLTPAATFFKQVDQAINSLTPETKDLQEHLNFHLNHSFKSAKATLNSSFTEVIESVKFFEDHTDEAMLATIFKISLMQTRYSDYYENTKK